MSSNNQTPSAPSASHAGSKSVEQGTWMYYEQATSATGKSEKTLKRYVKKGELVARRMGKQINSPVQVWITPDFLAGVGAHMEEKLEDPDIFDADSQDVDFTPETEHEQPRPHIQNTPDLDAYERMVKMMVSEFSVQLDRQKDVLFELRRELQEKDVQLRLLPDLQKQLDEREKEASIQTHALEKQVEALQGNLESQGKLVEELRSENEGRAKTVEDLRKENEKLRAESELITTKKNWWSWFVGKQ